MSGAPDAAAAPPFGSDNDVARAQQLWNEMEDYTTWSLMPGTAMFEPSDAPHGMFARIFINATAEMDPSSPPPGSIIIKQNYASDTEDDFDAITVMYRIDGYAPEYGDWFWAKFNAGGTLDENPNGVPLAGQIGRGGSSGCIPCHSSAGGDDFIFKN